MEKKTVGFIDQEIVPIFDEPPIYEKTPPCPDGFIWQGRDYRVVGKLAEWADFLRRGKSTRNMRPSHATVASRRGSLGVGRFHFRVRVDTGQVFDIYYDRAPKDANRRKGAWFLFRELST